MTSSSVSPVTADDDSMSTCLSISFSVCALYECLLVVVEMLQALQLSRVGTSILYVSSDSGLKVRCDHTTLIMALFKIFNVQIEIILWCVLYLSYTAI